MRNLLLRRHWAYWLFALAWAGPLVSHAQQPIGGNLVNNGTFSSRPAGAVAPGGDAGGGAPNSWYSARPYDGNLLYPGEGSLSDQNASVSYDNGNVVQGTFPGDRANNVAAASTWLLFNGNTSGYGFIWYQTIALTSGYAYRFSFYASNATKPGVTGRALPNMGIYTQYNNGNGYNVLANNLSPAAEAVGADAWTRYQGTLNGDDTRAIIASANNGGTNNVVFSIFDNSNTATGTGTPGGDVALTALSLQRINQLPRGQQTAPTVFGRQGPVAIPTLRADDPDPDGSVVSYQITALPPASQGTLLLNGNPVRVNQVLTTTEAASLTFDPNTGFSGNGLFTYTATDNLGDESLPLNYGIPINNSTCNTQSTFKFSDRPLNESWTASQNATVDGVKITSSNYAASAGTVTFQISDQTGIDPSAAQPGKGLTWVADYNTNSANTALTNRNSTVKFSFTDATANTARYLRNFTMVVGDVDRAVAFGTNNPGNGFIDRMIFNGTDVNGNTVTLSAADVTTAPNINTFTGTTSYIGPVAANSVTGTGNSGSPAGNLLISFPVPVKDVTVTYTNLDPNTDPAGQAVTFLYLTWCGEADLSTTISGPLTAAAGQTVYYYATTTNSGPRPATNEVTTITLPGKPAASTVNVPNGTYNQATGVVTFNPVASLAVGASVVNYVTFVMPAGVTSFTGSAASSALEVDNNTANNDGTATAANVTTTVGATGAAGTALACPPNASLGKEGAITTATGPNMYYQPVNNTTVAANQKVIALTGTYLTGTGAGTGGTALVSGDLVMIVQMQGGVLNTTNNDTYGDGVAGPSANGETSRTAGTYEYGVVDTAPAIGVAGNLTLRDNLVNSYVRSAATATQGQQIFQVIRIPQYASLTLNGTMSPPAWNGRLGGVLALDVAGPINFNGNAIDASGRGFRGGAGRQLNGATGVANTDYVTSANLNVNGTKGEGTAGTPRYVNANGTYLDTRTATTGYPTLLGGTLNDGYPTGDNGRGAPGNAGGGGTDGETGANQWNSGGAGGANGGRGGRGGNSFNNNLPVGGEPGAAFPNASSNRLVLGGGGGSGTTNDGSGTPGTSSVTNAANPAGFSSSGAVGGGMVLLRVGFVQGAGTILANGANANNTTNQDGGGGGGAGGSILVTANGTSTLGGLTLTANGGTGGNTNPGSVNATGHGPGGGGGAGIVFANAPVASATAQPGTNGFSTASNGTVAFGAEPGAVGVVSTVISNSIAVSDADANCVSDLTTTITGPLTAAAGSAVNLSVSFGNLGGLAGQNVTRAVTLPSTVALTSAGIIAPGATISGGGLNPYTITYPTLGTLAAGASNTYTISYTAPATGGVTSVQANSSIGPQGNTATNPDVYIANNTSSVTTTVAVQADVTTTITGPALVAPGTATAAFTATFTNNGPSQAASVTRTVTLPAGATITTAQLATLPSGTTYSGGTGGTLTFPALTTLNAGATSTVQFPITASGTPGAATIQSNVGTTTPQGTNVRPDQATFSFTVAEQADVTATINNNNAGTVTAGSTATFNVNFGNNGPSTAVNTAAVVQLPAGLSNVTVSNGGVYNATTGLVTYGTISLTANTGFGSAITFTMPSGPVAASATVNTDSNEGSLTANNTATASINSASTFDVTTRLTGPGTAAPGTSVTFDVLTVNNGPGIAPSTTQTVTIPGVFTSLFASNGGTYSNNGTNTTVTFPAIAGLVSGANVNNTITLTMPAAGISNATATVTATGDSNTGNNTSQASVTASTAGTGNTNLYTTISPALVATPATTLTAPVAPGTDVVLNVTIGNYGPTAATNTVTRVALPAGLSSVVPNGGGTYNATTGVVTFPAISLAQGATQAYTITLPAPLIAGPLVAVSSVASDMAETVPDDNVATTKIGITPLVDVATTLVGPTGPTTGQTATYAVTTTNNGPTPAYGVAQQVLLPLGLTNVSVSATVGGPTITLPTGAYNPATGVLTLPAAAVPATLAAGVSALSFVSFTTPNSSSYPVTAAVSTTSQETNVTNNSATVLSTTNPATDVSVTLTGPGDAAAGTNNVPQGNPITYTVTTTNNGSVLDPTTSVSPSSATTVQLPANLANVTVSGGGSYNSSTGLVTFPPITFQALGAAGAVTNTITFTAPSVNATPIVATAQVTVAPSGSDPILTNNSATVVTNITNASSGNQIDESTAITATVGGSAASASNPAIAGTGGTGNSVVFNVTSTNNTMSPAYTATGLVQKVQLPANLSTADVVLSTGGSYDPATGIVTFSSPSSQANGVSNAYTITLNNIPGGLSSIVATAIVTTDNSDSNPNNNAQSVTVPVTQRADLVTTVSGPTSANPGSPATYLVTTRNIGPSTASSVATTVQLPTGLTGVVVSGGGSYDANSGQVTFPPAAYLPGYSGSTAANNAVPQVAYTITLTTPSTITLASGFSVTATSATGTAEITTANNSATVTTFGPNLPPTALNVVNTLQNPQGNTAGALPISPLVGTDPENAIATYQLTSIPPVAQGVLFYNSNADGVSGTNVALTTGNFAGLNLTPAQAQNLKFDPGATYSGNVFLTYTVTDQAGLVSPVALYTIPINNDVPAVYTVNPPKSSSTFPYANNDVLATVADANGATYNTASVLTYNGLVSAVLSNASNPLPAGTTLNPTTGQITVTDRTQLVPGSYPLTITTTDAYGGVTVHTITLVIGGSPIAVDDFATTPLNTNVTFPVAGNDLANFGAAINAATIDLDPNTAGIQTTFTVTGKGTFTALTNGTVQFAPVSGFTGTATTSYTINNSASPAATSNQANLVVTVRGDLPVDLSTAITVNGASSATVNAGASTTLNGIAATNNGTTAAANVVQTVLLPTNLTTTSFTVGGTAGTLGSGGTITFGTGGPSYSQATGLLTYPPTTSIAAGGTQTYGNIVFPAPATSFVATAQVTNNTTDPTPANNVATVPVTVTPQFDLSTTLSGPVNTTGTATTVVSGDLYALTVTSRNAGPNAVSNALQTVTIGAGRTGVFVTGGGYYNSSASAATVYFANGAFTTTSPGGGAPSYPVATGQVLFPPMVLASGQAVANTISLSPTASYTFQAAITPNTGATGDTNPDNNAASVAMTLGTAGTGTANAYVTLTGPATATAGGTVSYSLTQGNRGPASALGVTTTVSLPTGLTSTQLTLTGATGTTATAAGFSFTGGTFAGATYNASTGVLTLPTLGTQASAATPQSATIGLPAPATGTYNVTATVATTNTDPVPGDNVASVMTTVTPSVDVAISLSGPATATAGQPVTYTATVSNGAGQPAASVVPVVSLPANLTATDLRVGGQTGTLSGTTIGFANGASYNTQSGVLTLGTIATLPASTSQGTPITFPAPGTASSLGLTATVSTTTLEAATNLANNRATATTTLTANADVVVTLAGPTSVTVGNPVTYTVVTTNNGPSVAGSQTTTVQLPTGLTGVVVRDNSGAVVTGTPYDAATGIVTFPAVSNLLPGTTNAQTGTITFNAPSTTRLDVAAVAAVPATNGDPNLDNNRAALTATTVTLAGTTTVDVAVTLTSNAPSVGGTPTVTAGTAVVYTLTTQNNTAAVTANNVSRLVSLATDLTTSTLTLNGTTGTTVSGTGVITFNGGPNDGATYDASTGVLTLPAVATLNNGTPVTTTITVTPVNHPLTASATVAATNTESNTANNFAQAPTVTVTPSADVATYLTAPATVASGGTVTYTVVTANNGPSSVGSVVQTVTLPTGINSYSLNGGAAVSGNTVTYTVSNLASGASQTNVITFTMPNNSVTGTASVPTTNDPVAGNNNASATTTLPNQAPVARDVVNALQNPQGNTAGPLAISPLAATDADGSVKNYQLTSIPTTTQGVLYYNNNVDGTSGAFVALPVGQALTQAQANNLRFDPASTFAGSVDFGYTATDDLNAVSQPARYTIQSGVDNNSVYTGTPSKGGSNTYQTNDVLAYVIDPNGASYNGSNLVYTTSGVRGTILQSGANNGVASAVRNTGTGTGPATASGNYPANPNNDLPTGTAFDPATGLIYVSDRSALPRVVATTYYQVNVITTDLNGGVNTVVAQFTLGAFPLPVTLVSFTAQAVSNRDGLLKWTTASEANNDHFELERSLDGTSYLKIGQLAGQGSKASATDYGFTDAGVAAKVAAGQPVYYRLKQVDTDGTSTYSPVRTLSFTEAAGLLTLFPNPAASATSLDLRSLPLGNTYQATLLDAAGRQVRQLTLSGGQVQELNLQDVASGTYQVLVSGQQANGSALRQVLRLIKE